MKTLLALAAVLAVLPWLAGKYFTGLLVVAGIYTIATVGLTILMGFAGQVSLAQGAFYGIGAYASMVLSMRVGLPVWLAILLACVAAAGVALAIGRPSLKLHGHHLALATLGFGLIVYIVFSELGDLTGGPSGMIGIPRLSLAGFTLTKDVHYYYVVWTVALVALGAMHRLMGSAWGRLLRALAASEPAAEAMGVDTRRLKLQAFVLSGALGGLAGALYAHWITVISPITFNFEVSIELLMMAVVGGLGSIWGSLLGATLVTFLVEALRTLMPALRAGSSAEWEIVGFGLLLIATMVFLPEGVAGGLGRLARRLGAVRA